MLAALIAPSGGTARVAGHEVGPDNDSIRASVGILTEAPGLYRTLTAWENLLFFAGLYGVPEQRAGEHAGRYLRMLDLWERRDDKVGSFSKGMRQKLALARALLHEPPVVFLDEPTAGLDPEAARTVREFIKELRAEGRTIFLTTHNLTEADELCDLIAVFRTRLLRLDTPLNLRVSLFGKGTQVQIAGDATPWLTTVQSLPFVKKVEAQDSSLSVHLDDPDTQNPPLVQALVAAGAPVRYVKPLDASLEDVYLELIEENS